MLMVFLNTFLYDVKSLFATGSPTESSTPGGIERGVRPSFEGRFEVVEKRAVVAAVGEAVACHAGTRKPGSVTGAEDEAATARPNAFPRLGANMAAIGVDMAVVGVLQCWLAPRTMFRPLKLNFSCLVMTSRVVGIAQQWSDKSGPTTDHRPPTDLQLYLIDIGIFKTRQGR
jgi:hypothetical protein